ncbi:hypothetical protein [Caldilinea sp.]|jgi:hypothetical protein|uniref:hypothetical protein n=1 Tax=Caldilinea sp. TaxID=2293560 RepID=UPI001AFCF6B3|nr:hypothetical protein [Caldilinea sp.]MBO9394738.1 hypothetical protein [Caldilinea sp.]
MKIRLECTIDGLRHNWIELAEQWTRAEIKRWSLATIGAAPEAELFDLLAKKLVQVHILLPDGTLIEDGETLVARFDDLDIRLVRWLAGGINRAIQELLALGEERRRLLFDGVEIAQPTTPAKTPN